jgi:hypothetical protein
MESKLAQFAKMAIRVKRARVAFRTLKDKTEIVCWAIDSMIATNANQGL